MQEEIDELTAKQEAMTADVSDSHSEYEAEKKTVIQYMRDHNLDELDGIKAVFRTKNEVNVARLLGVLEGDIDNLVILTKVQQKDLKDFAKTDPRKKDLLECIESGKVLSDIEIPVAA